MKHTKRYQILNDSTAHSYGGFVGGVGVDGALAVVPLADDVEGGAVGRGGDGQGQA